MIFRTFTLRLKNVRRSLSVGLTILLLVASLGSLSSRAQTKAPYSKQTLLEALRRNAQTKDLSTKDFIDYIAQRGVDFEMTTADEARFRSAGATPEVISAINENYRPPKGFGALTINSTVPECKVFLNGQASGMTDRNGVLRLRSLKVGQYNVTLKKETYEEQVRSIAIASGTAVRESFVLERLKGRLTVVPSIAGAQVRLGGIDYPSGISGVGLAPQVYDLQVSKPGFKTFTRTVTISPGQPLTIDAPLEPVPIEESLAQIGSYIQANRYGEAISSGREILTSHPDNAKANLLTGLAYYYSDQYSSGTSLLVKAIAAGEQVVLPIKHHHRSGFNDQLCSGTITIGQGVLAFHSNDVSGHDFSVPANKIYELTSEPRKFGRIHVQVGIPKGQKEDKKTYNFQVRHAGTRLFEPNNPTSIVVGYCNGCDAETQVIYQLIRQLKDAPTPPSSAPQVESDAGRPTLRRLDAPGDAASAGRVGTVSMPSSTYRSYSGFGKFKLDVPDNWKEVTTTGQTAVLAPEGAYTKVGERYNFSIGIQAGTVPGQGLPLSQAFETLVNAILKSSSYLQRLGGNQAGDIKGQTGLSVPLGGRSPITQQDEFVRIYAVIMKNGDVFYVIAVVPKAEASAYGATFGKIIGSVEFLD